jgi:hypothetical protein
MVIESKKKEKITMKQIKYSLIALLTAGAVLVTPGMVSADEVRTSTTGMTCSVNNYGNYSCVPRTETTVRKRTIAYVDKSVTNIKFLDTALSTSSKIALASVLALGVLGLAVKATRLAK